tara:strand:- start:3888 stop:4307 length:420 start_codon:yes stop_codon:yes gene_type:complete
MNEVKELQSKVLQELKQGPASLADLTLTLHVDQKELGKAVRGLREDELIELKSGVYHYSYLSTPPKEIERPIQSIEKQKSVSSPLDAEFQLLEERLKKPEVKDLELKTQVLEKLEPMLSGDIGQVLLAIRDDLKGVAGV